MLNKGRDFYSSSKSTSTLICLDVENVAEADSHLNSLPATLSKCHLNSLVEMPRHKEALEVCCQRLADGFDIKFSQRFNVIIYVTTDIIFIKRDVFSKVQNILI